MCVAMPSRSHNSRGEKSGLVSRPLPASMFYARKWEGLVCDVTPREKVERVKLHIGEPKFS